MVEESPYKISQAEADKELSSSDAPGPDGPLPDNLDKSYYVGSA